MSWPTENRPTSRQERIEEWADRMEGARIFKHPRKPYPEDESLLQAVIANPHDDAPRRAYADWMRAQDDKDAQIIAWDIDEHLRVADAYRADPCADPGFTSNRGNSGLAYDLDLLVSEGLISHPKFYRGFPEKVSVRGNRFLEIADELYSLAPIRHLGLLLTPDQIPHVAASPHLARIRSIAIDGWNKEPDSYLTDDDIERLLDSPYLQNVVQFELCGQHKLTQRAYQKIVTSPSLPMLSNFEVYIDGASTIWKECIPANFDTSTLSFFERFMDSFPATKDLRDTPRPVVLRCEDWIIELERTLGYVPCVHPEINYGRYIVDIEAVTASPLVRRPDIMAINAKRGQPVPEPGDKPALMRRFADSQCPICGHSKFERTYSTPEPYGDPEGFHGILTCQRCLSRYNTVQWTGFNFKSPDVHDAPLPPPPPPPAPPDGYRDIPESLLDALQTWLRYDQNANAANPPLVISDANILTSINGGRFLAVFNRIALMPNHAGYALATITIQQTAPGITVFDMQTNKETTLRARDTVTFIIKVKPHSYLTPVVPDWTGY
jgi:uncharacterized protein (TIGR02996 family)